MELNGFDANQVEPSQSMDPIPAAWYKAVITDSEEKPTKAQTGSYLQMSVEVIEGEYQGRKVFWRLNLNNPNQMAVDIAQRTLSSICRAVGVMTPKNSADLHDKPFMIKVKVTPAREGYGAGNDIDDAQSLGEMKSKASASPDMATSKAASPPWKR